MQDLETKATELEGMRLSRDAMVTSAEKEQDTVKKLRAEIAQLHSDKVLLFTRPTGEARCMRPCSIMAACCRAAVKLHMRVQAALKAEAAAEQEKIIKQGAEDAQQSIITQQARFDAEMGIMKNRLAHENVSHSLTCSHSRHCW